MTGAQKAWIYHICVSTAPNWQAPKLAGAIFVWGPVGGQAG